MSGSILSAMKQFLTPDIIAKMASASGVSDPMAAARAVEGAVPAILTALANLVTRPGGARQLGDAIAQQPPRALDTFATTLGTSLASSGKNILSDLLGGSVFSTLASAIARFAGLGDGATRSLLGALAPAVLGILGREQGQAGTSTSGLAQMLTTQKDQFVDAMPSGLSSILETSGFTDRADAASTTRASEAYRSGRESVDTVAAAAAQRSTSGASGNWLYWVLPLLAFGALFWYLLPGSEPTQQTTQLPPSPMTPSSGQKLVGGVDVQQQATSTINSLQASLQEVKDAASAKASLPKLEGAAGELDRLSKLAAQLPPESRQTLAQLVKSMTTKLNARLDDVVAMPGAASSLGPAVENLRAKLNTLAITAGAPAQQTADADRRTVYIAKAPSDAVLVSIYFNRSVYNQDGDKLGSVTDLLVRPDGSIAAAVIGIGGFLGIGEKEIAVPFTIARVARRDGSWHLVLDANKDALQNAPPFEATGERVRLIAPQQ